MRKLVYKSTQKATKEVAGITQVDLDVDGVVMTLGAVENFAGAGTFKAVLMDGTTLSDGHLTKKQAGGALQKYQASGAVVPAAIPTVDVPAPVTQVEEPAEEAPVVAEELEPVVRPSQDDPFDDDPGEIDDWAPQPGSPLGEILDVGDDFDPEDLLDIPAFLRRSTPSMAE